MTHWYIDYINLVWCREGWRLVVTGHSLGAGVAALLSLKLLDQYPSALLLPCNVISIC